MVSAETSPSRTPFLLSSSKNTASERSSPAKPLQRAKEEVEAEEEDDLIDMKIRATAGFGNSGRQIIVLEDTQKTEKEGDIFLGTFGSETDAIQTQPNAKSSNSRN